MNENKHLKDLLSRGFHKKEVGAISALLAGEISAVEAYNTAIDSVRDSELISILEASRNSHALRVSTLQDRMEYLREEALESSGWWGVVARLVERSATAFSDKIAMSVLLAGEDYGFTQYERQMKDLDSETYTIVESELLPEQGATLQTMTRLCAQLRSEDIQPTNVATDENLDKKNAA